MLKIRDDVDLKELEKYGFEPRYDEYTGKIKYYTYNGDAKVDFETKELEQEIFYEYAGETFGEAVYLLTKADLVEKVGDDNE